VISAWPRFWNERIAVYWAFGLVAAVMPMRGGVFGLPLAESESWARHLAAFGARPYSRPAARHPAGARPAGHGLPMIRAVSMG
jgi:hypothetical protein